MFPGAPAARPSPTAAADSAGTEAPSVGGHERAQAQLKPRGAGLGIRCGEGAARRGP